MDQCSSSEASVSEDEEEKTEEQKKEIVLREGPLKLKMSVLLPSKPVIVRLYDHCELRVLDQKQESLVAAITFDALTRVHAKKYRVRIFNGKKKFSFKTKNSHEADEWASAINEIILIKILNAGRRVSRSFN